MVFAEIKLIIHIETTIILGPADMQIYIAKMSWEKFVSGLINNDHIQVFGFFF